MTNEAKLETEDGEDRYPGSYIDAANAPSFIPAAILSGMHHRKHLILGDARGGFMIGDAVFRNGKIITAGWQSDWQTGACNLDSP